MIKSYDYSLETVNGICASKLRRLFTKFNVDCAHNIKVEYNVEEAKDELINIFWYSEDDIEKCPNKDEFLDKLEDLAIKYNL